MKRITIKDLTGLNLKPKELNFVIEYTKDFNAQRAAGCSGYQADTGYNLKNKEHINAAIDQILEARLEGSHVDAEWVLYEAVDNHIIARQTGNISASNTALKLIAQHTMVDAMAVKKLDVQVADDSEIMARLHRGRVRTSDKLTEEPSFF